MLMHRQSTTSKSFAESMLQQREPRNNYIGKATEAARAYEGLPIIN